MRRIHILWSGIAWAMLLAHEAWAEGHALLPPSNNEDVIRPVATTTPSVWNRITQGTKNMVSGTKDLLTPNKPAPKKTPWAPKPKQKTWYQKLFGPADPPPKPQSPSEWIMQPRVQQ
jgi:hypothetical protein